MKCHLSCRDQLAHKNPQKYMVHAHQWPLEVLQVHKVITPRIQMAEIMENEWFVSGCMEMTNGINGKLWTICWAIGLKIANCLVPKALYWAHEWLSYCVIKIERSSKALSNFALGYHIIFLIDQWGSSLGGNYLELPFCPRGGGPRGGDWINMEDDCFYQVGLLI